MGKMFWAQKLVGDNSRAVRDVIAMEPSITSMAANRPESLLVAGNSRGELLLYDLRRHPPELTMKKQIDYDGGILDSGLNIRQVEFFDKRNILVRNSIGLHLFGIETQTTLSSLSPKNTVCCDSAGRHGRSWKGDNFVGFSVFPKGTGSGEILNGASGEFAAISSSHVYSIDVRCCNPITSCQSLLWADRNDKPDQMFSTLTWNAASTEEHFTSQVPLQVKDDKTTSFDILCVTTHVDWICTGSGSGHIHCWDRRCGKVLQCWKGHTKSIVFLKAISRQRLLSAGRDKTAVLWDMSTTPPAKISSIYNIPGGQEYAMNITCQNFRDHDLVSTPGDSDLLLCAAAGRKAVFMDMPEVTQPDGQPTEVPAERIVMSDFQGKQIPSSGKLNIRSISLLPCRQLVLLGCHGGIQVCL